jgi:ferrous iron transport protein A
MSDLVPLGQLSVGESAEIEQLVGSCEHVRRLEEMGVRRGVSVEMVRRGSPCIVRLAGQTLCFRAGDLLNVMVRSLPGAR